MSAVIPSHNTVRVIVWVPLAIWALWLAGASPTLLLLSTVRHPWVEGVEGPSSCELTESLLICDHDHDHVWAQKEASVNIDFKFQNVSKGSWS